MKKLEKFEREEGDIVKIFEIFLKYNWRLQSCENRLNELFKLSEEDLKIIALEASIQLTRESLEEANLEKEMKIAFDFAKNEAPKPRFKCSVCD